VHADALSSLSSLLRPAFLLGHKLNGERSLLERERVGRKEGEEKCTLTFMKGNRNLDFSLREL